jgi:hypothetical protein
MSASSEHTNLCAESDVKHRAVTGIHMAIRRLERGEWDRFCSFASRYLIGKRADIETLSSDIGRHLSVDRAPIHGVYYDPNRDVIEIWLTDISHRIHRPREIYVDDLPYGLVNFTVIDAEGARRIIVLHEPLMLAAPARQ